jgi:two-component system cell cycle response regulator DivK
MQSLVLIIEDQPLHAKFFAEVFRGAGLASVTALTGNDGLVAARANSPELIIVDLCLPDRPGHEVIAELRRCPKNYGVPIIAITAATERESETLSLAAGADVFLTKPVRVARLKTEVKQLLQYAQPELATA